ncbi:MAG: class I SAM-dependent methyltransferase [Myxococcales bacterium]|nr:class I SAM-dependent methyltransferase [Myxococcales bacterium]
MTAADLDAAAAAGAHAVAGLRAASGVRASIDARLRYDGNEILDREETPPALRQRILGDVERISRLLGIDRLVVRLAAEQILLARRTRRGKPVRVLDVGTGTGHLLFRLQDWAHKRRIAITITGIDFAPEAIELGVRRAAEEGRRADFRVGDARALALEADEIDVAISTFTLHHLPPADVARVLFELDRVAAVGYLAFDLRRSLPALPALWAMLHAGRFEAPTRHDSLASLRRAYSIAEITALAHAVGLHDARIASYLPAYYAVGRA